MTIKRILFVFVLMFGVMALAQTPTPNPVVPNQDLNSLLSQILEAFSSGKLTVGIAGIVVAATYLFRKLMVDPGKVGSGALPWVSVILGVVFGVASNVLFGATPASAASAILLSGPLASQLWSSIFKLVVKKAV